MPVCVFMFFTSISYNESLCKFQLYRESHERRGASEPGQFVARIRVPTADFIATTGNRVALVLNWRHSAEMVEPTAIDYQTSVEHMAPWST